jgi:hypothetical protein
LAGGALNYPPPLDPAGPAPKSASNRNLCRCLCRNRGIPAGVGGEPRGIARRGDLRANTKPGNATVTIERQSGYNSVQREASRNAARTLAISGDLRICTIQANHCKMPHLALSRRRVRVRSPMTLPNKPIKLRYLSELQTGLNLGFVKVSSKSFLKA